MVCCFFVEIETRCDALEKNRTSFIHTEVPLQKRRILENTGECWHRSQLGIGRDGGTGDRFGGVQ